METRTSGEIWVACRLYRCVRHETDHTTTTVMITRMVVKLHAHTQTQSVATQDKHPHMDRGQKLLCDNVVPYSSCLPSSAAPVLLN